MNICKVLHVKRTYTKHYTEYTKPSSGCDRPKVPWQTGAGSGKCSPGEARCLAENPPFSPPTKNRFLGPQFSLHSLAGLERNIAFGRRLCVSHRGTRERLRSLNGPAAFVEILACAQEAWESPSLGRWPILPGDFVCL